jgi:hypothetical protein
VSNLLEKDKNFLLTITQLAALVDLGFRRLAEQMAKFPIAHIHSS